jgi:hypothetical protein
MGDEAMPDLSRRHLVTTAAGLPALALPAAGGVAALPTGPAFAREADQEVRITELWARRQNKVRELRALHDQIEEAEAKLPEWARGGPMYVNSEGEYVGQFVGWPAVDDGGRRPGKGAYINRRPGPGDIRRNFELSFSITRSKEGRRKLRSEYKNALTRLNERRAKQRLEEDAVGLGSLHNATEIVCSQISHTDYQIVAFPKSSPARAAAVYLSEMMFDASKTDYTPLAAQPILEHLRPHLTGLLAQHVDDVIAGAGAGKQMGDYEFWG